MPTYTIVDKNKTDLEPGEIPAGQTVPAMDGDIFIIDSTANDTVTFIAPPGQTAAFDVIFDGNNANMFKLDFKEGTTPTLTVADTLQLPNVDVDAALASGTNFFAGHNVTFGKYTGSVTGPDTVTIGDNFTTDQNWKFGGGESTVTVGDNATFRDIDTSDGADNIVIGHNATVHHFHTGKGDDTIRIGDNFTADDIKLEDGNDSLYLGDLASVGTIDGGNGTDSFTTETAGIAHSNMESAATVCFAAGTLIVTGKGERPVEEVAHGDLVLTLDSGLCPVLWARQEVQDIAALEIDDCPVRISAEALGPGRPAEDLVVSPQHRILVGGQGQLEAAFEKECFVPAKALTGLPGIRAITSQKQITWVHFTCARHQIVRANGAMAESMLLGPVALATLKTSELRELVTIFGAPGPMGDALNGPPARPCIGAGKARRILHDFHKLGAPGGPFMAKASVDLSNPRVFRQTS